MFDADVIGIMTDHEIHVNQITNRHGVQQEQAKFVITDGRLTNNYNLFNILWIFVFSFLN